MELVFEVRDGRPQCREVHVLVTEKGHEVTVSAFAGIRIDDALEMAIKHLFTGYSGEIDDPSHRRMQQDDSKTMRYALSAVQETRSARAARKVKITDAMLRDVAEVYRANLSNRPTAAVAEHVGMEHRTGAIYVKQTRERGFLGAAVKGKAGEQ